MQNFGGMLSSGDKDFIGRYSVGIVKILFITLKRRVSLTFSGVASLDLMLGHIFYNRPRLATSMLVHTCIYI